MSTPTSADPKVGFVSLGCPKALVDSERILTQLRAEGYRVVPEYANADVVVVNTCGFIDSAVEEQPGWLFRVAPRQHIDRDARLRRLMAGREAFNRGDWLREPPAPSRGAMAPALLGQLAMH